MTIPTFVDLQGFTVGKKFRESDGVEKRSHSLSLYFYVSHAMEFLDKVRKILRFLVEGLSPWITIGRRDDPVHHGETPDYNGCNWYRKE